MLIQKTIFGQENKKNVGCSFKNIRNKLIKYQIHIKYKQKQDRHQQMTMFFDSLTMMMHKQKISDYLINKITALKLNPSEKLHNFIVQVISNDHITDGNTNFFTKFKKNPRKGSIIRLVQWSLDLSNFQIIVNQWQYLGAAGYNIIQGKPWDVQKIKLMTNSPILSKDFIVIHNSAKKPKNGINKIQGYGQQTLGPRIAVEMEKIFTIKLFTTYGSLIPKKGDVKESLQIDYIEKNNKNIKGENLEEQKKIRNKSNIIREKIKDMEEQKNKILISEIQIDQLGQYRDGGQVGSQMVGQQQQKQKFEEIDSILCEKIRDEEQQFIKKQQNYNTSKIKVLNYPYLEQANLAIKKLLNREIYQSKNNRNQQKIQEEKELPNQPERIMQLLFNKQQINKLLSKE